MFATKDEKTTVISCENTVTAKLRDQHFQEINMKR